MCPGDELDPGVRPEMTGKLAHSAKGDYIAFAASYTAAGQKTPSLSITLRCGLWPVSGGRHTHDIPRQ